MALFCWREQHRTVESVIRSWDGVMFTPRGLCIVDDDGTQIQGRRDIVFLHIMNHHRPIPPKLRQMLRIYGAVMVAIDDTYARERYGAKADD